MRNLGKILYDVTRLMKAEFEKGARSRKLSFQQWRVLSSLAAQRRAHAARALRRDRGQPDDGKRNARPARAAGARPARGRPFGQPGQAGLDHARARPIIDDMRHMSDAVYDKAMAGMTAEERDGPDRRARARRGEPRTGVRTKRKTSMSVDKEDR